MTRIVPVILLLVLVPALDIDAALFDDFEYDTPAAGGWEVLAQTGDIATIEISTSKFFSGTRSLCIESRNQDHFWDLPCDRSKFCALEKALPNGTVSVTFAYRVSVKWKGRTGAYHHGESSACAKMGLRDDNGCTFDGQGGIDLCSNACGSNAFMTSNEWLPNGLLFDYDSEQVGADGNVWRIKTVEVPDGSDLDSLLLDFLVNTNAWSQDSDYAFTHVKLWIDYVTIRILSVPTEPLTWSMVKSLY